MIDVTVPAAVRMTISDTTLSETIFSIVPGKRFRTLVLMVVRRILLSHNFDRHHHAFILVFLRGIESDRLRGQLAFQTC
jgi:hypothetical protein